MDSFIGQVMLFAGMQAPRGWAFCDGRVMPIAQNQALFALLGTQYGGDGRTNFQLPDLRDQTVRGITNEQVGTKGGAATVTLTAAQLPPHNHSFNAFKEPGTSNIANGSLIADTGTGDNDYASTGTVVAMNPAAIANAGGGQPVSVMQPYLGVNYIIALQGIFPSRS
jgi:microcystin-dependent protein